MYLYFIDMVSSFQYIVENTCMSFYKYIEYSIYIFIYTNVVNVTIQNIK